MSTENEKFAFAEVQRLRDEVVVSSVVRVKRGSAGFFIVSVSPKGQAQIHRAEMMASFVPTEGFTVSLKKGQKP